MTSGQLHVLFGDAADGVHQRDPTASTPNTGQRVPYRLERPVGIGLDDEPQLGVVAGAQLFEQLLEPLPGIGDLDIALAELVGSLLRDCPRLLLAPHDLEAVPGGRKLVPTHGQHGVDGSASFTRSPESLSMAHPARDTRHHRSP